MHIKEIRIRNFKTYKNMKLNLTDGLNVITGPNGSGKSNILEAIIFGLRERNPKMLRVPVIPDVIRKVNGEKKGNQVSISITVVDKGKEIIFDRRISHNGKMAYYVNGKRVKLKVYLNYLLTFFDKPLRFRYVAQGVVIKTAEMTSKERGKMIGEIAGISSYDEKKNKAVNVLNEANQKLNVSIAKTEEIKKNITDLFEESIAANRFKTVQKERNKLIVAKKTVNIKQKEKELFHTKRKLQKLEDETQKLKYYREQNDQKISDFQKEINQFKSDKENDISNRLQKLAEDKASVEAEKGKNEWKLTQTKSLIQEEIVNKEKIIHNKKQAIHTIKEIKNQIKKTDKEITDNIDQITKLKNKEQESISEINQIQNKREEIIKIDSSKSKKKKEVYLLNIDKEAEKKVNKIKQELIELELSNSRKRFSSIDLNLKRIENIILDISQVVRTRRDTIKKKQNELKISNQRKRELQKDLRNAEKIYERAKTVYIKIKIKKKLQTTFSKTEDGSKKIMQIASKGLVPEAKGLLSEMIKCPKEIKPLLKIVAGEKWNSIIVENWATAEKIYGLAKKLNTVVSIIVLNDFKNMNYEVKTTKKLLSNHVTVNNEHKPIIHELFGSTIMVETISEAFEALDDGYDSIDENAEYYLRRGLFKTNQFTSPLPFQIIKIKNIKEIENALENFGRMINLRRNDLKDTQSNITKIRKTLFAEMKNFENGKGAETILKKNLQGTTKMKKILQEKISILETTLNETIIENDNVNKKIKNVIDSLSEFDKFNIETTISNLDKEIQKTRSIIIDIQDNVSSIERININQETKKSNLMNSISAVFRTDIENIDEKLEQLTLKINQKNLETKKLEKDIKKTYNEFEKIDKIRNSIQQDKEKYYKTLSEKESKLGNLTQKNKNYVHELEKTWNTNSSLSINKTEIEGEIKNMLNDIKNKGFNYPVLVYDSSSIDEVIKDLDDEIERIGSTNLLAKPNYLERVNNYKQFSFRRYDLESERRSILNFIDSIDQEKEKIYMDAFNKINNSFIKIFTNMFPDGKAELEILDENDIFEQGINIMIQFPKKSMVELSSLSGGEKSVVVVSLLLALQSADPGAIYLFDEIDAHLDARNTSRFTKVISDTAKENQIIIVTLKSEIAEMSDYLIGITMRNQISRIMKMPNKILS